MNTTILIICGVYMLAYFHSYYSRRSLRHEVINFIVENQYK